MKNATYNLIYISLMCGAAVGSVLVYAEGKFATHEAMDQERVDRKEAVNDLSQMIQEQSKKLDNIYEILLEQRRHR
jgi:hypothetical protein